MASGAADTPSPRPNTPSSQAREAGELNMLNKGAGDFPDQIYDFHENYGRPLKALRFVAHGLDRFPERAGQELTQLTQLTLASNRLTELPDSICDLAKLSALNYVRVKLPHSTFCSLHSPPNSGHRHDPPPAVRSTV